MNSTVTSDVVSFFLKRERPREEIRKLARAGYRTECARKVFDLIREDGT